jgi:hypothetical protein
MSVFYVGQVVHCVVMGKGCVHSANPDSVYPLFVHFDNGKKQAYTIDGRMFLGTNVCLYTSKPEIIVPEWQPKAGEWYLFTSKGNVRCVAKLMQKTDYGMYIAGFQYWEKCTPLSPELVELLKMECDGIQ